MRQSKSMKKSQPKSSRRGGSQVKNAISSNKSRIGYAPVAMSRGVGTLRIPQVTSTAACTHIRHTEYFASVVSTGTAFGVTSYPCNPGVSAIFPWLSQVAQRYETYKFRDITIRYHTRASTTQVGTVGMAFDFDAQDSAPTSQMDALMYHDHSADSCWKQISLRLDLAMGDKQPIHYTRAGLPASPYDIKTLDLGNLFIFTDGVAASTNLGLLEVTYSVDLYSPQIQDGIGGSSIATANLSAVQLVGSNFAVNDPQSLLPCARTSNAVLTFDQRYEGVVCFRITGTVLSADFAPVAASGDAAVIQQVVDAGGLNVYGWFRVRASPGTTLTPTITATSVTQVVYYYARGSYVQFGG